MTTLMIIAACERVIIDQKQMPSLIGIFQNIEFSVPDAPMPENALSPFRWYIFTLWQHTADEVGREFVQHARIITPDGKEWINAETRYTLTAGDLQGKVTIDVFGIPISQMGTVTIQVSLNDEKEPRGTYVFNTRYQKKETPNEQTPTPGVN